MKIAKSILLGLGVFVVSCSIDNQIKGGELFEQYAVLNKIESGKSIESQYYRPTSIALRSSDVSSIEHYSVTLLKENKENIQVYFSEVPNEVQQYNKIYGTSYLTFPSEHIEFTQHLTIEQGKSNSEQGTIIIKPFAEMLDNTPYMVALSATSSNTKILSSSKTLFYIIEKVKGQIKQTFKINRDQYFAIDGANGSHSGDVTLEGLIYVEKFRGPGDMGEAGISTFMGEEGQTLLRFGDASVDPNHLQANGTDIGFKFKTKKWYHIAITVNAGTTTAYVNGEKVAEYSANGNLSWRNFFIGRSWSENRGIEARFAELKVWTIGRTGAEIKENMFETDPSSIGLFAYWKMNEVKNNRIPDISGNGRNLVLYNQRGVTSAQDIKIFNEETPIKL